MQMFFRPEKLPDSTLNPASAAKVILGRRLFFDPILSGNNRQSCASCHRPEHGWSDPKPVSMGANGQPRARRTPSLFDVVWNRLFAWDGRVESLEGFVLGPVTHPLEMDQNPLELVEELKTAADYPDLFAAAFPEEGVSLGGVSLSIAAFVRRLRSGVSPFDRWIGGEEDAVSSAAKNGFALFRGKGNCISCHQGWRFTDNGFHDTGLPGDDPGRGAIEPDKPEAWKAFKTPGLRNVALHAPYMHDGSLESLEAVLDHYQSAPELHMEGKHVLPITALSENEKLNIIAFLKSLTEDHQVPY